MVKLKSHGLVRSRAGITLLESVASLAVTLVVGTLVAQATVVATRQLRADTLRQLAAQEATNLMEQLVAQPDSPHVGSATPEWALSDDAQQQLPDGSLSVTVVDNDSLEAATRITVEVNWRSPWEDRQEHVRLVSWHFAHKTETTP